MTTGLGMSLEPGGDIRGHTDEGDDFSDPSLDVLIAKSLVLLVFSRILA